MKINRCCLIINFFRIESKMSPTPDISDLLDAASLNSPLTKVLAFEPSYHLSNIIEGAWVTYNSAYWAGRLTQFCISLV